ncbi:hypothetical protein GCM10011575_14840 [Microlunatus endophyticus]|uniref:Uncharacterized protein n=1 Tax=Microlunatus endophyticus TaxID=1716077 RepID=A0A917W313_9ACTN|nr:hypothetical protein [Microlunatus endophyticus]GGL57510.1 hypothetical protein GCM10011575_14840 [Microlunatus endophyticus]
MIAGTGWKLKVLKNCAAVGVLGLLPEWMDPVILSIDPGRP